MSDNDGKPDNSLNQERGGILGVLSFLDLCIILGCVFLIFVFIWRRKKGSKTEPTKASFTMISAPANINDPSFVNKMKHANRNIVIFYGSQTGTAEDFANRLVKEAAGYGMKGMAVDPEECDMEELKDLVNIDKSVAIFCVATYGEGDPTDNAQEFYEWLQAGDARLDGFRYAVFGLGNKTYEHYNDMGKYVDRRLAELGGTAVYSLGLGDDDGSIEEDFVTWKDNLFPTICETFGISSEMQDIRVRQYKCVQFVETDPDKLYRGEVGRIGSFELQKPPFDAKNPFLAPIQTNRELHKSGDRSCMHIEFDITGSRIRYETGDHVAVLPINDPQLVEGLGKRLNEDLDVCFSLNNVEEDSNKKHPFPCPCSYRTALSHYLDIMHPPKTNVLREFADYASDPKEAEFLKFLSSSAAESKIKYKEWIQADQRNILAVLEDLPSIMIPIEHLCELLPRLQARYYSISSSPKMFPNAIHITAVLIDYHTRVGRHVKGVATSWLALKHPVGDELPKVPIYVRRSQFRMPYKVTTPMVMIGPGTGVAPFRGFIQERLVAKRNGKPVGDMILFYGCRKRSEDYIYEEDIQEAMEAGSLTHTHLAFSRDQDTKVYVQHLMLNQDCQEQIWNALEQGGHFYVCGDARNMARDVHAALETIIVNRGGMSKSEAQEFIKKLQAKGRYAADVWS